MFAPPSLRPLAGLLVLAAPAAAQCVPEVIPAPETPRHGLFASTIAARADALLVGAPLSDAVHAFRYAPGEGWTPAGILRGTADEYFGQSVALSPVGPERGLVGAIFGGFGGAAYVIEPASEGWAITHTLAAFDASMGDKFGEEVDLRGGRALVANHPIRTDLR